MGGGGSQGRVFHTLSDATSSFVKPVFLAAYPQDSVKGIALEEEVRSMLEKGAIEPSPLSPGFYSRLFLVPKSSGGWRPVIDLSTLNKLIVKKRFNMETTRTVLQSIRRTDWLVSIDLKDAYFQIPIHPSSRKFLRFVSNKGCYQFKALCFGLTTAPQVFTRVMALVSSVLHLEGIRILRYLDDWLILASSQKGVVQARDRVLMLCSELGILVNLEKSDLVPTQCITYLGMVINVRTFSASPTSKRIENLFRLIEEFLSSDVQVAHCWQVLLGHLSSLAQLVPGGHLRLRSLQLILNSDWDFQDLTFVDDLQDKIVAVFCDNTTAISYLRRQGGTFSSTLNDLAQQILRWAESQNITIRPQFVMESRNVVADTLSRRNQIVDSEWTLNHNVFRSLQKRWPVTVDLFATSLNHRLPVYFTPVWDSSAAGVDAFLQNWDNLQMYAFPPFSLIQSTINKLRSSVNAEMTLITPFWPQREWFPELQELSVEDPIPLPLRRDLLSQPHFHRFHLRLHMLSLHAWRLSSGSPSMKVSHRE